MAKSERGALARALARDVLAVAGAALVSYGAWLTYEPAGFVVAGLLLLATAVVGSIRSAD